MRILAAILALALIAGCSNETDVSRAAGNYPGTFKPDDAAPQSFKDDPLLGYLQLYAGKSKFQLELQSKMQSVVIEGTWTAKADKLRLVGDSYTFQAPPEEEVKARNLQLVSAEAVRQLFGKGVVLTLSDDRRKLTGLKSSFGPLMGHFEFTRPIPR